MHAFNETHNAIADNFGWKPVRIRLKGIRRGGGFGINGRAALVREKPVREKPGNEFLRVGILEMNQMARAIEGETFLLKRAAKPSNRSFLLVIDGIVFGEMMSGAESR